MPEDVMNVVKYDNDFFCAMWRLDSGWWGTPQARDTKVGPCCISCHSGLCYIGCSDRVLAGTTYKVCCKTKALCIKVRQTI